MRDTGEPANLFRAALVLGLARDQAHHSRDQLHYTHPRCQPFANHSSYRGADMVRWYCGLLRLAGLLPADPGEDPILLQNHPTPENHPGM